MTSSPVLPSKDELKSEFDSGKVPRSQTWHYLIDALYKQTATIDEIPTYHSEVKIWHDAVLADRILTEDAALVTQLASNEAKNSETAAKNSETAAKNSETAAKNSETAAFIAQFAAELAESNSKNSETAAKASEVAALDHQNSALAAAQSALSDKNSAAASEAAAVAAKDAAVQAQAASEAAELVAVDSSAIALTHSQDANTAKVAAELAALNAHSFSDQANTAKTAVEATANVLTQIDYALIDAGTIDHNNRYVFTNPFGINTPALCMIEIQHDGTWFYPGEYSVSTTSRGAASYYKEGEGIIVITGYNNISDNNSSFSFSTAPSGLPLLTTATARVHVWRVKG